MFESFGRGFRMIGASIKMGWQDKRLLFPSILIVFTNIFFGLIMLWQGAQQAPKAASNFQHATQQASHGLQHAGQGLQQTTHGLLHHGPGHHGGIQHNLQEFVGMTGLNGPLDQSGLGALGGMVNQESVMLFTGLMMIWWLTNRFLEGVTTALVYSHLTEGTGTGKFSQAFAAVFASLPALVMLGLVTFIAKKLAGWLRDRKSSGVFGFGFNFLASVVEVFWTLAGHLILPAIVIEGTSFWGGLKRADKIASGNLLTIGVGEVGVDAICRLTSWLIYMAGLGGFGYAYYLKMSFTSPMMLLAATVWALSVVMVTALSIYIRSAFYTCLYAWAIDAEAVQEAERVRVKAPEPLAAALA